MANNNNHNQTSSLLDELDKCPPFMAYYGHHLVTGKRLTVDELAEVSGMSRRTFTRTARRRSWEGVRLGVLVAFCRACGVNLFDTKELYSKLAAELASDEPFKELPARRRKSMLALFNMLAASTRAEKEKV